MPETELLGQLSKIFGPVMGLLVFLAIIAFGFFYWLDGKNGRKTSRDDIKVIRTAVERNETRMDRHLEHHGTPAD